MVCRPSQFSRGLSLDVRSAVSSKNSHMKTMHPTLRRASVRPCTSQAAPRRVCIWAKWPRSLATRHARCGHAHRCRWSRPVLDSVCTPTLPHVMARAWESLHSAATHIQHPFSTTPQTPPTPISPQLPRTDGWLWWSRPLVLRLVQSTTPYAARIRAATLCHDRNVCARPAAMLD